MTFHETDLGYEYRGDQYLVFFGKKDSSLENLQKAYPHIHFKSLWQVHGNDLLQTTSHSENNIKADAHWTVDQGIALITKSADCIPVLAVSKDNSKILAIHAGWRGVQNRIIPKSLKAIGLDWHIYIGPHITKESFVIQEDCLNLLKQCTRLNSDLWYSDGKADLYEIILNQISEATNGKSSVHSIVFDTKTDNRFHSHRRDHEKAGRQNSFIVLL